MIAFRVLALCVAALPLFALAKSEAAPANVLLSRNRTEPVVAVDASNPAYVVAVANTNYSAPVNGTLPLGVFRSADGGHTFVSGTVPIRAPFTTAADPTVAIAKDGTTFVSYLGEVPAFCEGGNGAVLVSHSTDHGRSFRPPVIADISPSDDKPSMAVESGLRDHIFLVWDRVYRDHTDVWFTRSLDGGAHFERSRRLYRSHRASYGPVIAVRPTGRLYVFWSESEVGGSGRALPTRILVRRSTNDGTSFGRVTTVVRQFRAMPQLAQPGSLRTMTMPSVVVDRRGAVWLAWARPTAYYSGGRVDVNIEVQRSANGGASWSQPLPINDVPRGDRFMPALTVMRDGSVGAVFYDRRRGGNLLDVVAARLWASGNRVSRSRNVRLNARASPVSDIYYIAPGSTCFSPGRFFGDYLGVAPASAGSLCAVWADTQLRVPDETDIWFARLVPPGRRPSAIIGGQG